MYILTYVIENPSLNLDTIPYFTEMLTQKVEDLKTTLLKFLRDHQIADFNH